VNILVWTLVYWDILMSVLGKRYSLLGWENLGWSKYTKCLEWCLWSCSGAMELPRRMVPLELYSSDKGRGCSSWEDHFFGRGTI